MTIYQIFVGIVMLLTISKCESSHGILCGLFIYACLSIIPLVMKKEAQKKVSKEELIRRYKKTLEDEEYFNNFGQLP